MQKEDGRRIEYLDGLRGVAIIMVILFHAYARWSTLYPYGNSFVKYKFINTGTAGVHLFFIISGFVIFMSLDKMESFRSFAYRRWIRLFPAMLVCSIILVATAPLFPARPNGAVGLFDWLPGLSLAGDEIWRWLLGDPGLKSIEGAFWSLYVEVYFYLIFGLSYFYIGRRRGLCVLIILYSLVKFLRLCNSPWAIDNHIYILTEFARFCEVSYVDRFLSIIKATNYAWFIAGALYYIYYENRNAWLLVGAVAIGIFNAITSDHDVVYAHMFVIVLFSICILGNGASTYVNRILKNRFLLFFGFVSYPLYLVHENIMVSAIVYVGKTGVRIPAILMPVGPIFLVVFIGWVVAWRLEPRTRIAIGAVLSAVGLRRNAATTVASGIHVDPA